MAARHGADVVRTVVRRFYADRCLMRASALAYASLLSMVPLFAIMFAALKGLGVQDRLEPLLLSRLSLTEATTAAIIGYIDRTNVRTLGAVGAATLVLTVISLLGTIEASFNHIWRVARQRSLWRKITDYLGVVVLTPFLLLAATALTSAGQVQSLVQWVLTNGYLGGAAMRTLTLAPLAINAVAIGVLYAVMPNRRGALVPIAAGAVVAGTAWYAIQTGYVALQIGVARYNAIYGALAQLPVTLVWLYVSWGVVLAGAELAAVMEFGADAAADVKVRRDAVALHVLVRAGDAFRNGGPGVEVRRLARELRVDVDLVQATAGELVERGWLAGVEGYAGRFVLTRDPAHMPLGELLLPAAGERVPARCDARVRRALAQGEEAYVQAVAARRVADLLDDDANRVREARR